MSTTAHKQRKRIRHAALARANDPSLSAGRRQLAAITAEDYRFEHPTKGPVTRHVPSLSPADENKLLRAIRRMFPSRWGGRG